MKVSGSFLAGFNIEAIPVCEWKCIGGIGGIISADIYKELIGNAMEVLPQDNVVGLWRVLDEDLLGLTENAAQIHEEQNFNIHGNVGFIILMNILNQH